MAPLFWVTIRIILRVWLPSKKSNTALKIMKASAHKSVHLLYRSSATCGNTLSAATVEQFGVAAFFGGHRVNNRFDTFESIVIDVHVLDRFSHTGNHRSQIFEITHFFDLVYLAEEVVKVELVFGNFLL